MSSITGTLNNGAGTGGVITNPSFSYDSNGNMLSQTGTGSIGRTLTYAAFNVPATITNGTSTLSFTFDSRHKRIIQTAPEGTTVYLNGGGITSEKFTATGTGVVTWRNYVIADGAIKLIYSQTDNTSGPNWGSSTWGSFTWTSSTTASTPLYLHQDHLGSVVAISGSSGSLIEQDSYDPWGKRRNTNGTDDTYDALTSQTTRGYTEQEHLGDLALIHMNARVYDPQIGRFSGTDPKVGQPYASGGWNRYAYVGNNPLNRTDPTGMDWFDDLLDFISDLLDPGVPTYYDGDCDCFRPTGTASSGSSAGGLGTVGTGSTGISEGAGSSNGGPQTPAKPAQAEPQPAQQQSGHDYRTQNQVCKRQLTNSEAKDLISRFGVPSVFLAGSPTGNGEHMVTNDIGLPGGFVQSTFSADGLSVTNVTTPVHVFVGTIVRTEINIDSSGFIATHGFGNAGSSLLGEFRDDINGDFGPGIFNQLDSRAAAYAAANYPGC